MNLQFYLEKHLL